jgi:hypothetical protein
LKLRQAVSGYPEYTLEALLRYVHIRGHYASRAEAASSLQDELLKPGVLRKYWEKLSPEGQGAVSMALHNKGVLDIHAYEARFDELPDSFRYTYRPQDATIDLFFFGQLNLPEEYWPVLREWVEPLPPYELPAYEKLPELRRGQKPVHMEQLDLERVVWPDWTAALTLIATQKIRVSVTNNLITPSALKQLRAGLMLADFYPQDGNRPTESIRITGLVNVLLGANFVSKQDDTLKLTSLGAAWLSDPTAERLREGFWNWVQSNEYDEIRRITHLKDFYDLTAPSPRRKSIASALTRLPLGKWVSTRDFFRAQKNWGLNFQVEVGKHSTMRATGFGQLAALSPHIYISLVQGRYVLVILMEMLSAFGALDLAFTAPAICNFPPDHDFGYYGMNDAFSRYDGLQMIRLTPLGAFLLGMQPMYTPVVSTDRIAVIQVHPDLKIQVLETRLFTAADRATLERCCAPQGSDWFRLDAQRTIKAIEEGLKPGDFLTYVERKSTHPLPEDFHAAMERWKQRCNILIRGEQAVIFQVKNLELMKELLQDEPLRNRCWLVEEHQLAVPINHEKEFIRRMHELEAGLKD